MAYGLSEINQNGVDYRLNDPNITNEFSESTAYAVGEYVNYNGLLYRFKVAHSAGAWDTSHVTEVKVGSEFVNLKSIVDTTLMSEKNLLDTTVIYTKTSNAVTNNEDGTYTIGTTDYGTVIFGAPITLLPGVYTLYGVSMGYSFLSTTTNYGTAFITNDTNEPKIITLDTTKTCYLGYRNNVKPTESYVITPYLYGNNIVEIKNSLSGVATSVSGCIEVLDGLSKSTEENSNRLYFSMMPGLLATSSQETTNLSRRDYIYSWNSAFVSPGDVVRIHYNMPETVTRIIWIIYNKDEEVTYSSYSATGLTPDTDGQKSVTVPSDLDAYYLKIMVWKNKATLDPDDYKLRLYCTVESGSEETTTAVDNTTEYTMMLETGAEKPEDLTWSVGYIDTSTGVETYDRKDYVHNRNGIACVEGDVITVDMSLLSNLMYSYCVTFNIIYYDSENVYTTTDQKTNIDGNRYKDRVLKFTVPKDVSFFKVNIWSNSTSKLYDIDEIQQKLKVYVNRSLYSTADKVKTSSLQNNFGKEYTTRVLGANPTGKNGVTVEYENAMKDAISQWMSAYAGDERIIPAIIHTDQHGQLWVKTKPYFDTLSYLTNWDGVSAVFNLGDTIRDHWENDDTNTDPLLRNSELEGALQCLETLPKDKAVNVIGNHDMWYTGAVYLPSLKYNNPYFVNAWPHMKKCPDNSGNFVLYDDNFMVKYLVIGSWDAIDYTTFNINATHWRWIIKQMSENDDYDIVLVSHVPIIGYSSNCYNPISGDSRSTTVQYICSGNANCLNPFVARRNKTSGSITVGGDTISYDFTGCTTNILCSIAGHTHEDIVDRMGDANGMLAVAFDRFGTRSIRTFHFILFDRAVSKLKVWRLSGTGIPGVDNTLTPTIQNWEAPF